MSTHNICFYGEIRKKYSIIFTKYTFLTSPLKFAVKLDQGLFRRNKQILKQHLMKEQISIKLIINFLLNFLFFSCFLGNQLFTALEKLPLLQTEKTQTMKLTLHSSRQKYFFLTSP